MHDITEPSLSVVVVTRDGFRTLLPIVRALREQSIVRAIELIVVAPDAVAGTIPEEEASAFHSTQVVSVGPVTNRGRAAAAGVAVARAPIVALSENHCFPAQGWAEGTLASHAGPWSGVGPAVENANPESSLSVALHAAGYGMFPASGRPGPVEELPLHNASYVTERLLALEGDLEHLLADERRLQARLRARGERLFFDPHVLKWHINEATWGLLIGLAYSGGRRYAGVRSREWPFWKRLFYALSFPLLSFPIASNVRSRLPGDCGGASREPWLSIVIWLYALAHSAGEAVSYVAGEIYDFPFAEDEEFYIRERLGKHALHHPDVAAFVDRLDAVTPSTTAVDQ